MSTETKYVRITKCNSDQAGYWYNKYIGAIFPAYIDGPDEDGDYKVLETDLYIHKDDCEEVKITVKGEVTLLAPIQQTEDQKKHLLYLSNFLDVQGHRGKAVELRVAFPEVFMAPRTYRTGQKFIGIKQEETPDIVLREFVNDGRKYVMMYEPFFKRIAHSGQMVEVEDFNNITVEELNEFFPYGKFFSVYKLIE